MDFYKLDTKMFDELTTTEYALYRALLSFRHSTSAYAFPDQEKLSLKINKCKRTVQRTIQSLVEKGYIVVEKQKRVRQMGHWNKYLLNFIPTFSNKSKEITEKKNEVTEAPEVVETIEAPMVEDFSGAVIAKTKIEKISKKQKDDINSFNKITILQVLGSKKGKCARHACYFIELLITEAIKNGSIKDFQIKKFNILMPIKKEEKNSDFYNDLDWLNSGG